MTQVDFYILPDGPEDGRLRLACRLADKAVQSKLGVFVLAKTEADARKLDELLWTVTQNSFLPHRYVWDTDEAAVEEPILIGCLERAHSAPTEQATGMRWDLMINLSDEVPETFERYQRLAEVVDGEPERRERGRERYRYYRDRGYALKAHQL